MGTHLFVRGLSSNAARKSVLEAGITDLAKVLAEESTRQAYPTNPEVSGASLQTLAQACLYCGKHHLPGKAYFPAAEQYCSKCDRKGHFPEVCRASAARGQGRWTSAGRAPSTAVSVKPVTEPSVTILEPSSETGGAETFGVWSSGAGFVLPLRTVLLDDVHSRLMRVDSASMVSVLPKSHVLAGYQLRPAPCPISPLGTDDVQPLGVF